MKYALCIGHLAYDIILPMEGFPEENTKYQIDRTLESSGGPAANAAVLMARWGIRTGFIGSAGRDSYGERALEDLQSSGVDTRYVHRMEQGSTPLSIILVNTNNGSRTIINRRGEGFIRTEETTTLFDALKDTPPDLLLFDGHEPDASHAALEYFPEAISILDAGSLRRGTELLAPRVDYCIASERFAREVAGTAPLEPSLAEVATEPPIASHDGHFSLCRSLLATLERRGIQHPVITLGEGGCCFLEPVDAALNSTLHSRTSMNEASSIPEPAPISDVKKSFLLSAYPAKAVDTTGAGDVFHGAFAAALLLGKSFQEALIVATVAAGLSVERLGGKPGIPTLEEVSDTLERWNPSLYILG
ncbi:MAG: sugar kinase [Spirochaetales bacterium]